MVGYRRHYVNDGIRFSVGYGMERKSNTLGAYCLHILADISCTASIWSRLYLRGQYTSRGRCLVGGGSDIGSIGHE